MNPVYMPQQYGAPPSNFPQTRPSPALTPQSSFQNIPLGGFQKPPTGPPLSNGPQSFQNSGPPSSQFPPSHLNMPTTQTSSHSPPSQIPPGQLPPQKTLQPQQFGTLPVRSQENLLSGPPQFQNGPPTSSLNQPEQNNEMQKSNLPSMNGTNVNPGPLNSGASGPYKPNLSVNQFGQPAPPPPLPGQNQKQFRQPNPYGGQPPLALPGQPLLRGGNHSSASQPSTMPPYAPQHSIVPGQPPLPGQPSLSGQPVQSPLQTPLPLPGQPPVLGQPQILGQPPLFGQPSLHGQPSFPHPQQQPGQLPMPGQQPPNHFNQQPPNQFGQNPLQFSQQGQNQLVNQMQGMTLSGPQYPVGPGKPMVDGGPHMPPPINQPGYVNGPQVRSPQAAGFPPMPGQPPLSGQPPVPSGPYPPGSYQQPQQQRRLDPDQMPSPIQVTQDDQRSRSGIFCTNQKGLVPPLVSTNFIVQDQGNASPRFIRSTMYNVPVTQDLMKQTAVPFGLVISPMAKTIGDEYAPPIVNFGELGPVRCIRCKAYMCPYMQFIDSGRRFQCLFCKAATDVPSEYFQHLDHTGQRMDRFERPELVLGSYEFTATTDYCRNNTLPKSPALIFVIDVSYNNIKSGLVHLLCSQMREIIKNLPIDQGQDKSNMKVGFITYNSTVHFYNIKGSLAAPQMLVVSDVQEMFMPLLDGFLCLPEESEIVIDALMQQIPVMFGDTRETETILLPAILAGLEALKASECSGKLLVFHSTLPIAEAPGKLRNRDDRKLLSTEKERTVLTPQTQAYNQLGQECVGAGCCVDLFLFNNAYIDLATIGQVSRLTGGEIFKYTYFQADIDGDRLIQDIVMNISRPIAFDAIMRVRTSTGIRATDFYGHFFMSNTTDMELSAIDCDKAVAVEIKHDDKLTEEDGVYVQVALLYTSCSGQRRLRVLNLSLKTCSQMADLYRSCELDTIINFFGKQSVYKIMENNPKAVKDGIVARAAQILANYRKNCASPSSAGQLILPECMKLLPLYVNCLLKSDALSGGSDMTLDDRSFMIHVVMVMDVPSSVNYFYPRLIPIHEVKPSDDGNVEIPPTIRTSIEKINDQGVYLLENGTHMFLYIGLAANPEFVQQVFGVPSAVQINIDKCTLPDLDNSLSIAVRSIIDQIRIERHRCMRLTLVRQREKLEPVFKHFLVEDRGIDGSPSYVDFLCHMHKEIRTILS